MVVVGFVERPLSNETPVAPNVTLLNGSRGTGHDKTRGVGDKLSSQSFLDTTEIQPRFIEDGTLNGILEGGHGRTRWVFPQA